MKVIDLLNKIANGEQPKHIKVYNQDWYWNDYDGYVTEWSLKTTPDAQHYLFGQYRLDFALDKEVEVIEEPKKIEKIDIYDELDYILDSSNYGYTKHHIHKALKEIEIKINNLVDYINKGDE